MNHHAWVLQQRIEIAAFGCSRYETLERIRCEKQKSEEAHAHQPHHGDDPCEQDGGQVARERAYRKRPSGKHQRPQQQRSFVRTPGGRETIVQRQLGIRVRRHILDREVVADKRCGQTGEGDHDQKELSARRRPGQRHQSRFAESSAGERQRALRDGDQQRQDQCEMPELRDHLATPCAGSSVLVDIASCAFFTASAAAGGM